VYLLIYAHLTSCSIFTQHIRHLSMHITVHISYWTLPDSLPKLTGTVGSVARNPVGRTKTWCVKGRSAAWRLGSIRHRIDPRRQEVGRAHVCNQVTGVTRMYTTALKKTYDISL